MVATLLVYTMRATPRGVRRPKCCECLRHWCDTAATDRARPAGSRRRRGTAHRNPRRPSSDAGSSRSPSTISDRVRPDCCGPKPCAPAPAPANRPYQCPGNRRADEAGGTGDQRLHAGATPTRATAVSDAWRLGNAAPDASRPDLGRRHGQAPDQSADVHLSRPARRRHRSRQRVGGGVDDDAHGHEGQTGAAATCATPQLSMSTATAPVSRKQRGLLRDGIDGDRTTQ